jgi:hypothetical protein
MSNLNSRQTVCRKMEGGYIRFRLKITYLSFYSGFICGVNLILRCEITGNKDPIQRTSIDVLYRCRIFMSV